MNRPTLRQLDYLIALKEHQSFSKAAAACSVTQAALSLGIKDLETLIGYPLIDRSQRKVVLTLLGNEIAKDAAGVMDYMNYMGERVRSLAEPMSGPVRMGVIPTIAPYLLPKILPSITEQYPNIELQIDEDLTDRLVAKIGDGKLDLILIALPFDTPELEQMHLFYEEFYYADAKSDSNVQKIDMRTKDINPDELLLLKDGHCLRDHALNACNLQLPTHERAFSATSMATLIQMVAAGFGTTLLPEMAVKGGALPENVVTIPFDSPRPYREVGLAWRKRSLLKDEYKALGAFIKRSH